MADIPFEGGPEREPSADGQSPDRAALVQLVVGLEFIPLNEPDVKVGIDQNEASAASAEFKGFIERECDDDGNILMPNMWSPAGKRIWRVAGNNDTSGRLGGPHSRRDHQLSLSTVLEVQEQPGPSWKNRVLQLEAVYTVHRNNGLLYRMLRESTTGGPQEPVEDPTPPTDMSRDEQIEALQEAIRSVRRQVDDERFAVSAGRDGAPVMPEEVQGLIEFYSSLSSVQT